jgi:hypothetical protein
VAGELAAMQLARRSIAARGARCHGARADEHGGRRSSHRGLRRLVGKSSEDLATLELDDEKWRLAA